MMNEKILEFLKKAPEYISGDYISQRLGISRQALWKHIRELKESGYDIAAVPHLGYRLCAVPDRLYPCEIAAHLGTRRIGRKAHYLDAVDSTMNVATALGMEGCAEGTLVVAETQTRGRGRLGRDWTSPKHKGIYVSILLRPKIRPQEACGLTLLAAVSVCEAVGEITGLEALIKWPNDVFLGECKLAGILTELNAETDTTHFVVIGLGLNVNSEKRSLPPHATSLKEHTGVDVNRTILLQSVLRYLEKNYFLYLEKGPEAVFPLWRSHTMTLGRRVKISYEKTHIEGVAVDIDTDGGLLVREDSGVVAKVMAGDVVLCR